MCLYFLVCAYACAPSAYLPDSRSRPSGKHCLPIAATYSLLMSAGLLCPRIVPCLTLPFLALRCLALLCPALLEHNQGVRHQTGANGKCDTTPKWLFTAQRPASLWPLLCFHAEALVAVLGLQCGRISPGERLQVADQFLEAHARAANK